MRKIVVGVIALTFFFITPANAHQPVVLRSTDTSAIKGPLLVDGTVSFAVRASFAKQNQTLGFRAGFKKGDRVEIQYLIIDKKPESSLKQSDMPVVIIISPTGKRSVMKIDERTNFFEPYSKTDFLFLARYSTPAEKGTYSVVMTSKVPASITIAIGSKEIPGRVTR
jgi:hypothetical protein